MSELPTVTFVIVDYNGLDFLTRCIESIDKLEYPKSSIQIIVVENGKDKETKRFVNSKKGLIFIQNKSNNYCLANNIGAAKAKGEYLAFLNNDTELDGHWLSSLVDAMSKDKKLGAAGGKILFPNKKIQSVGQEEHPNHYWGDIGFNEEDKGQHDKEAYRKSLCGAAILVRKKCFKDIGGYDTNLKVYMEDVDFSIRAAKKGYRLLYVPKSIAYHHFRSTFDAAFQKKMIERNRLLILAKYAPEKVTDAISTSQYFYIEKKYDTMFEILPEVIDKLMGYDKPQRYISHIIETVRKVCLYEKNAFVIDSEQRNELLKKEKKIEELKDKIIFQQDEIHQLKEELIIQDKQITELNREIIDTEKENNLQLMRFEKIKDKMNDHATVLSNKMHDLELSDAAKKEALSFLKYQYETAIKEKESTIRSKDSTIKEKDNIIERQNKTIEEVNQKARMIEFYLKDLKSSIPYRFIIEPIEAIYSLVNPHKRKRLIKLK